MSTAPLSTQQNTDPPTTSVEQSCKNSSYIKAKVIIEGIAVALITGACSTMLIATFFWICLEQSVCSTPFLCGFIIIFIIITLLTAVLYKYMIGRKI